MDREAWRGTVQEVTVKSPALYHAMCVAFKQGFLKGFPDGSVVKNLPANAGDMGSIPGLERSPGEGNGNPL